MKFLYRIFSNLKQNFLFLIGEQKKRNYFYVVNRKPLLLKNIPEIIESGHNCALIALHLALPKIPESKILEAFYNCCDKWPRGGVTFKEFNIVLRYLKIFEKFKYYDGQSKALDFYDSQNLTILLIPRHFTVICKNQIYDLTCEQLPLSTNVYRSWMLMSCFQEYNPYICD